MSGVVSLFPYDILPLLAMLPDLEHEWVDETILVRRQPGSRPRDALHQIASVATRHHQGALAIAVEQICGQIGGRPARAMLARLGAGGAIEPHADEGIYTAAVTQLVLPLITNPGAWFEVDGLRYQLAPGTVYGFDKDVIHAGRNDGDEATVHLIVDCHPDSAEVFAG